MDNLILFLSNHKYTIGAVIGGGLLLKSLTTKGSNEKFQRDIVYVNDFPNIKSDLPSYSPFVLKVIVFLEYNNIPYKVYKGRNLGPNPRGKNPFIRYNDEFVYDSHFILEWLYNKFNMVNKMDILDNIEQAHAHITKRFVDEAVTKLIAYNRWVDPISSELILPRMFVGLNEPFKTIILRYVQRCTRKAYLSHGIGHFSRDEINSFFKQDIESLATILGNKKFFFGDNLTIPDISIFSALAQILFVPVDTPLKSLLLENQNLVTYVENVKHLVFTDARWTSLCQ